MINFLQNLIDAVSLGSLYALAALGLNILDNQDLEAVGDLAAKQNRWEFMLTINPVPVVGGTGFPLNAIAMF